MTEVLDPARNGVILHTPASARSKEYVTMRKDIERKLGSTVYERIQSVRMSEADRERTLRALYDADLAVDAFFWVAKKIEQLGERLFLKHPVLKH
jgi:hypothetical protein